MKFILAVTRIAGTSLHCTFPVLGVFFGLFFFLGATRRVGAAFMALKAAPCKSVPEGC